MNSGRNLDPVGNVTKEAREAMQREMEDLRRDVERLFLINEALWRIVRGRLNCTDPELAELIYEIDLEDGHLNGRKGSTPARKCPECGRALVKQRWTCFYCGKPVEFLPFER